MGRAVQLPHCSPEVCLHKSPVSCVPSGGGVAVAFYEEVLGLLKT